MDNSWKNKLDYALHSSVAVQEPRNQRNINTGNYIQQFVAQDLSSTLHQRMHDHMPPNGSNFFSHKLSHSEQSNSYLALLSGPPSLLQCDFQELASQKVFNASRSVNINDCGSEVPQVSGALLSEHLSNQNTRKGTSSSVPPRVLLSSSNSGVSVLNGRNLLMDQMQVVNNPMLPGTEKVKEFPTPKGDWYGSSSANSGKLHSKTIQIPSKIPEESNLFLSDQSSIILSGCPRVFCLNTGGYLLLSNTGLLGIVCSCHFSHTSVSKFCEHSGFCDMNPGDAVRMESGETIAQWRKIYFEKFGIRVPEDQSGWDWPEGLLSTGGLAKSGLTMPKIANNSHLDNSVCSSQGFAGCMDNTMFLSSSRAGMSAATGLFRNKQEQKADGSSFLLKHLIGMPESNLHDVADGKRMECFVSKNSTISTTVGGNSDNCCPSLSAWIDSILKTGNSSLIHYSLQNLRTLGQNYDVTPGKIANDSVIFGRDGTNSSSSVELKLGQPYQQSLPMGNSCLPVIAPSQFDKVFDPPKTCYPEQMLHHARFFEDESRQYCHHDANSCDPAARRQQSQFNLGNHAFGVGTVMEATKLDKCLDDASKSSAVPLHPQLPPEGSLCSRVTNNSVFSMPNTFSCVADTTQCDPLNAPLKLGNNLGRQLNISDLGFNRLTDKGKGAASACVSGGFSTVANSTLRCHKQVQNPGILNGGVPGFSALHHKDSRQSSNIASEYRIDERRCLNLHGSSSFIESSGNTDRAFLKMLSSNFSSGQSSQSHAVSIGSPLATSTCIQGPTFNVSQQESPCLLDDSMRLVALKQIFELSKQHAILSVRMNHEYGRLGQTSNPSVQLSFTESSKSKAERHESILPSKQDLFKGASTPTLSSTAVKSIPTTGFHNDLDFSTLTQGISVCSREIDGPCQFSNESLRNQSALRLIRGEIIAQPSEHAKCCQRLTCTYSQGNCICLAHGKCLEGYSECRVGRSHVTSKEQLGVCCEAPMSLASKFVRDQIIPKDRNILLDEGGKMNEKLPMRIACHASQWRDVPSKQKEASKMAHTNPSAEVLDASGCAEGRLGGSHMHCVRTAINGGDSLKGQDVSNISSGCSAPAVTQASIEVNKMDSSTVNAGDNGYINGFVVDEGSGIDKCCSSDDGVESERSAEFLGLFSRSKIREKGPSKVLNGQSPFSLLDELKLIDSLTWKKGQKQICTSLTGSGRSNLLKKFRRVTEARKRKKAVKCKIPDASFAPKVSFQHCSNDNGYPQLSSMDQQTLNPSGSESYRATHSVQPRELSSAKIVSRKRILDGVDNDQYSDDDYEPELKGKAKFNKIHEAPGRKKSKRVWDYESFVNIGEPEPILRTTEKTAAGNSVCCLKAFSSLEVSVGENKARPIVCGEFGEICNGKFGLNEVRPAKIVPLSTILKNTENLTFRKSSKSYSTVRKSKKKRTARRAAYLDISPDFRKEDKNGCNHALAFDEMSHVEKGEMTCDIGIKQFDNKPFTLDKVEDDKGKNNSFLDVIAYNQSNTRCKEVRKRSLLELTSGGKEFGSNKHLLTETSCYMSKMKVRKGLKKTGDTECHGHRACNINAERSAKDSWCSSIVNADLFCCVCGSSNKDECNCLLECSRCSIRVHQACYGISKAPKGQWYCRPCRTSSKDIVCVLCGYGGGAMTRALQSRAFMKDLLKAWNIEAEWRPKSTNGSAGTMLDDQILVVGNAFCNLKFKDLELSRTAGCKMDVQNKMNAIQNSPCHMSKLNVYNSVTEGMLDSTVKQWVHMVCGLWTPGTRCPNVDTMSAFDVSGVSCARENVVCSICNRPGGSCIRCRVVDCSVRFHPWCAHQKGLLQSEVEGVDNENVGFYGRCMLHALHPICESGNDSADELSSTKRESICARTEGFKGRKQDGFCHNIHGQPRKKGGCFVPQEQLNAWIHINGQKSCLPGPLKLPASDIEYNCRKEYARYKQAKGWKHLVVYKSGIHALGLYTSQFISRGEMVVEYVGEIVGSRVADKRENEYQSGRKVQYKSACYFFRIDKEHIIDATRKGGIARFVNHSCLPNCVAKVISVRNEKKVVVFFAQRDIYPGEEITYDYNFNHEDEGKKIPCFCNSKNCRRYLN